MLIKDALAVQKAGAQLLLLEAVPPELSSFITKKLKIPVYGIGAGPDTDGQLLIISDLVGQFQAFTPKFVKKYCDVAKVYVEAVSEYIKEVKANEFPADVHCYHVLKGEEEKVAAVLKKFA
jgi:3-methyl-2-oxobutanoate hydroxymethyltransferase